MGEESYAERRLRLRPLLSSLENRKGGSAFLDLCEMLLMLSDDIDGGIEWDHPRVVVKIRQIVSAIRIAKRRGVKWGPPGVRGAQEATKRAGEGD